MCGRRRRQACERKCIIVRLGLRELVLGIQRVYHLEVEELVVGVDALVANQGLNEEILPQRCHFSTQKDHPATADPHVVWKCGALHYILQVVRHYGTQLRNSPMSFVARYFSTNFV